MRVILKLARQGLPSTIAGLYALLRQLLEVLS